MISYRNRNSCFSGMGASSGHPLTACFDMPSAFASSDLRPSKSGRISESVIMRRSKARLTRGVNHDLHPVNYDVGMPTQKYSLPQRLEMVMTHLGLNKADFARECGVQRQHINNWMNGAMPNIENLRLLLNRRGINPFWILWEEGEMIIPLFRIPAESRDLYEFVASLDPDEARQCLESLKLLRAALSQQK